MSYILDALRRAEAERERERGAVPGVHTQPAVVPDAAERARPRLPAWWGLAAGGLLGGALVAALWWVGRAPAPATPASLASPSLSPSPSPSPSAQAPVPAPPAAPVVSATPMPPVVAVAPSPAPLAVVSAPVAAASPAPPPSAPAAAPPAESVAAPLPAKPQPWSELTAEQRREWPALAVGGAIYSDNAASRFVMINGQVVREGEAAAPGVTVERIGPKSAVLRFKDRRVELPF